MLQLTLRLDKGTATTGVTLALDQRIRSRMRVTLDNGTPAGVILPRGQILRDGSLIGSEDGYIVKVNAAPEAVSRVDCDDALLLARLAYHLGNRHVPLQIEHNSLRYQHDHVLDDMVRGFGVEPTLDTVPFEPEAGAYDSNGHGHHHSHEHDHHTHDDKSNAIDIDTEHRLDPVAKEFRRRDNAS